jgi:hypothetical protein
LPLACLFLIGCGEDEIEETPVRPATAEEAQKITQGLTGTWAGVCRVDSENSMSFLPYFVIDADGTFLENVAIYLNTECSGQPADTLESKGEFVISGVLTDTTFEVEFNYSDYDEDDYVFLKLRITQKTEAKASVKIRELQYYQQGAVRTVPSEQLELLPALDYFKL